MTGLIDWSHPIRKERIVRGKPRTDTCYPVCCPQCGGTRLLRSADAKKAEHENRVCLTCHTREAGRKGYQATAALHGEKFSILRVQQHRLANPSCLEAMVMQQLDSAGITYERETLMENGGYCYLIDFVIGGWLALEIQGAWAHQFHHERDQRKQAAIRSAGYTYEAVTEAAVPFVASIVLSHLQTGAMAYA